jgi:type IV secretion system protein TrbJ
MRKKKLLVVGLFVMNIASSALAGGGGVTGGSTEITQLLNNGQLMKQVIESVKTTYQLEIQTAMQIKQLWYDAQNLKNLGKDFVDGNMRVLQAEMNALQNINTYSNQLYGNLSAFEKELKARQVEALNGGLSMSEYVKEQGRLIDNRNGKAQIRFENEKRLMKSIEEDYKMINKWGQQIPQNEGVQQSMGLLNTQMNYAVQQLSRVSELLNQQNDNIGKSEALAKRNEDQLRNQKLMDDLKAANDENADQMKKFKESLKRK